MGLNVFECTMTSEKISYNEVFTPNIWFQNGFLPTMSQELCVDNSIPTAYGDGESASIVFGESAYFVTDDVLSRGVVLDGMAALILQEKGIDVGLRRWETASEIFAEYFCEEEEYISVTLDNPGTIYRFELDKNAEIKSVFLEGSGVWRMCRVTFRIVLIVLPVIITRINRDNDFWYIHLWRIRCA